LYGPLLEAGIHVLEYNHTMLHQKTMVVDGVWGTIGTTNFDSRSFAQNEENNVCFYDREMAGKLEAIFMQDVPLCDVVTLEAWRKRGVWAITQQFIASLLQEQV
jgi:cardiolipin synthase